LYGVETDSKNNIEKTFIYKINLIIMEAKEIFTTAGVMWALTLTGLAVGFGLLKVQGE
jgi:hypothetical protein